MEGCSHIKGNRCIAIVKLNDVARHGILLLSVEFLGRICCWSYYICDLVCMYIYIKIFTV